MAVDLWCRFERDFLNYAVHFLLWNRNTLSQSVRAQYDDHLRIWVRGKGVDKLPRRHIYHESEYSSLMSAMKGVSVKSSRESVFPGRSSAPEIVAQSIR